MADSIAAGPHFIDLYSIQRQGSAKIENDRSKNTPEKEAFHDDCTAPEWNDPGMRSTGRGKISARHRPVPPGRRCRINGQVCVVGGWVNERVSEYHHSHTPPPEHE